MNWNIKGKTVLITGATSGIGKETAISLASMGAKVIFTARDKTKGKESLAEIKKKSGSKSVSVFECDFSSFASVKKFAGEFKKKHKRLDVLINNAGTWENNEMKVSKEGIELTFQVNHLAPFLLTNLLLDLIKKSTPSRIINVSSIAHFNGHMDFDDLESKRRYDGFRTYANSKLANVLFTKKLAKMLKGKTTVNCLHPGVVATGLYKKMNTAIRFAINATMLSPKEGAKTSIYLAASPEIENITGEYFDKEKIVQSSLESKDAASAEKLWKASENYLKKYLKK